MRQKKHEVTIESLIEELEQARILAMNEKKNSSAAVTAIMGKAKLLGLDVQKHELTGKLGTSTQLNLNMLSDDELYKIATGSSKNTA